MPPRVRKLRLRVPLLHVLRDYQKAWLWHDALAGVTVTTVAIPQAIACAQLAGAPLTAGLSAGLVAMIVFAFLASSRQVILSPDSAVAALTGSTVLPLAHGSPQAAATLIAILATFIGIAALIGVVARVSFIAEFLSRPILLGYMTGLALTVITFQVPELLGIKSSGHINFIGNVVYILTHLGLAHSATIGFSLILIAAAMLFQRKYTHIPTPLVLLVGATIASSIFHFGQHGIALMGHLPTGLPIPKLNTITITDVQTLVVPAVAIMIICYISTITTSRAFAAKSNEPVTVPQDLVGLGAANVMSGVFGGIPVTASGTQTAINHAARGRTQVAQLFAALTIAIVLVLLAPLLRNLPVCCLAVIISRAIARLFDFAELRSIWHAWRAEAWLAVATAVAVAALGIIQGLLLAVFLAIAILIRQSAMPYDAVLGVAENGSIHDMSRPPKSTAVPGLLMYRFDAPLYFANANFFRERVLHLIAEAEEPIEWFLWDAETVTALDSTAGKMLDRLFIDLEAQGIVFAVARMKGPIRAIIDRSQHLSKDFEAAPHYSTLGRAIESFKNAQHKPNQKLLKDKMIIAKHQIKTA